MKKILLIEDDQIVANIYRNKFANEGYQVECLMDGEAALTQARSFLPDLIILDLILPKISGVELIKQFRAEPALKETPIVVFSNTYLTNMVQEAWKAGATKCLSKANCTPRQILDVIRSVIGEVPAGAPLAVPAAPVAKAPSAMETPPPPAAAPTHASDAEFQADLSKTLREALPGTLAALRTSLQAITKSEGETRLRHVNEMYRRIRALTGNAGVAGMNLIAQTSDAFEALLKELFEKPQNINASTLRTVATAIDFLGFLFSRAANSDVQEIKAGILVVDDEAISRRAVVHALERAKLKPTDVADPNQAYQFLTQNKYDLVFLDVDMPGMNGFELCTKLRALPGYKKTPVVFVTSLTDFESRASSMMSGGNDFIAKPFLFMELALKALIYVLRGRLAPADK
jgi:CheY-like chemotaxis protein